MRVLLNIIKYIALTLLLFTGITLFVFLNKMMQYGAIGVQIPTMLVSLIAVIIIGISSITYLLAKSRLKKLGKN